MHQDRRPIGYWLKYLDQLIEESFERALGAEGLTRRHWQVLNTIASRPTSDGDLRIALQPFLVGDPTAADPVIRDLAARGWAGRQNDGMLVLTENGRAGHAAAMKRVTTMRELVRRGISDDEYVGVVSILQRMAANLESDRT